jgi:hypothetical protein
VIDVAVTYDRTKLSTTDLLRAKATVSYHGKTPTYMVIVDLGIPPGFTVDAGDFAELVGAKRIQKYSVTARQVTLYLGDVKSLSYLSRRAAYTCLAAPAGSSFPALPLQATPPLGDDASQRNVRSAQARRGR